MKIRSGFVSNSSSSSFICDVCGNEQGGFDVSLSDVDMVICINDHIFCSEHTLNITKEMFNDYLLKHYMEKHIYDFIDIGYKEWLNLPDEDRLKLVKSRIDENKINFEQIMDEMGSSDYLPIQCPICQMNSLADNDIMKYFYKKNNLTYELLLKEIKSQFYDYDEFKKYIGG